MSHPTRCKLAADWTADFAAIAKWPHATFTTIHTYSTYECFSLSIVIEPAVKAGLRIWPTVFHGASFDDDKNALVNAIKQHGSGWLVGVSVGNEALRAGYPAKHLAEEIYDIRRTLSALRLSHIPVGMNDNEVRCINLYVELVLSIKHNSANLARSSKQGSH